MKIFSRCMIDSLIGSSVIALSAMAVTPLALAQAASDVIQSNAHWSPISSANLAEGDSMPGAPAKPTTPTSPAQDPGITPPATPTPPDATHSIPPAAPLNPRSLSPDSPSATPPATRELQPSPMLRDGAPGRPLRRDPSVGAPANESPAAAEMPAKNSTQQ